MPPRGRRRAGLPSIAFWPVVARSDGPPYPQGDCRCSVPFASRSRAWLEPRCSCRWLLNQLAGGSARLTVAEVRAHLSPGLQQVLPAEEMLGALRRTLAQRGPLRLVGYSYPPRLDQVLAPVRSGSGQRAAVAIAVDGAVIDSVAVDEAPPTLAPRGRYSGWFDVAGGGCSCAAPAAVAPLWCSRTV
jgi:hypothetical protein